jgi:GNAT superfamily N-acetyltransferase
MSFRIIPYDSSYESAATQLMKEINEEFGQPAAHPSYKPKQPDFYWLAFDGERLIGMIALLNKQHYGIIKRMFVHADYRGTGLAVDLLQTVVACCKQNNLQAIHLGTIDILKAAQRFYSKQGFHPIDRNELPADYDHNPIDTLFYTRIV